MVPSWLSPQRLLLEITIQSAGFYVDTGTKQMVEVVYDLPMHHLRIVWGSNLVPNWYFNLTSRYAEDTTWLTPPKLLVKCLGTIGRFGTFYKLQTNSRGCLGPRYTSITASFMLKPAAKLVFQSHRTIYWSSQVDLCRWNEHRSVFCV